MKTFKKIKIIFIFSIFMFMEFSCTDGFEDLNTPNNLVTEDLINVNLVFTLVQVNSIKSGTPRGTGTIGNYCGMSYSGSNRPFLEGDAPEVWNSGYNSYTNNLSEIIRLTKDDPELINKTAIARIMKVWAFAKMTDTYGDIPYFESSLPPDELEVAPKYDTQKSIYEDFFKELKEAAADLDAAKESYGAADLIYSGDVTKWKKFANSLRLRLALRVRYVDAAMATENMSDLQASDLILTRADDASIYTVTDFEANQNPRYNNVLSNGFDVSKSSAGAMIIKMKEFNDPRIKIFADTAKATFPGNDPNLDYFGYRGRPVLGLVPVEYKLPWGQETSSRISDLFYVPVIEIPVIRSSEMHFALAEAALFGLKAGDAQAHYKQGMIDATNWLNEFYENSAGQLPDVLPLMYPDWTEDDTNLLLTHKKITSEESDTFLNSSIATLSGSQENQLEQIIVQKNIALYPLEYQGWAEWRRTGYPILQIGPDQDDLKGVVPRRMPWPTVEQTINGINYDEAESRIAGGNARLSKFWWDANPNVPYEFVGDPLPTQNAPYDEN